MSRKTIIFAGVFLAALGTGAVLWLYINKPVAAPQASSHAAAAPRAPVAATPAQADAQPELGPAPRVEPTPVIASADVVPANDPVAGILTEPNLSYAGAVEKLLAVLPTLPGKEQSEAARHICNLSDDKSVFVWARLLEQNTLPQPAAEVFISDLANRPHALGMPVLAAIADQPSHPQFQQSQNLLEVNYGTPPDGTSWRAWVETKLAETPKTP